MPNVIDPRTPVIIGVAQRTQRPDDLAEAVEAVALMKSVVEQAATDAGAPSILADLDLVAVVNGAWRYSDPGRLVADGVGAENAKSMLSYDGGNTPQSYVNALASRIQAGEFDVVVITGAETIWSRRRQRAAGMPRNLTEQLDVEPDERFQSNVTMSTEFEASRGLEQPINFYPIFESAVRGASGRTIEEHRTRLAELWSRFNDVATRNPHAWSPDPLTAAEIREPSPSNRMVGFPYTKVMNSNWDLDQGAAILLCSVAAAERAGVARDRWIFPLAGTDAHDTYSVSNRRDLHSSPAINAAGARLFELSGRTIAEVDHVDIYSCFPSAVQVAANELGLDLDRRLTVTGGLPFAGGPLNNYVTHSIAAMVDVLRSDPGSLGLVTANGGYLTKHALGLYSSEPAPGGFVAADVQELVDQIPLTRVAENYVGPGVVEAATVMHDKAGPAQGIAAVRTPDSARTWAVTTDPDTMAELMSDEIIGAPVVIDHDGHLVLVPGG